MRNVKSSLFALAVAGCSLTAGEHTVLEADDPLGDVTSALKDGNTIACDRTYAKQSTSAPAQFSSYSCLPGITALGSELTTQLTCPPSGVGVAATRNANRYPLVAVLADAAGAPDPARCVAGNYYSTRFSCTPGATYHVVLDHEDAATESLEADLRVSCAPPSSETSCTDGWDDDGDHYADCKDPDCAGTSACPVVTPAATLSCGDTLVATDTAATGSTDVIRQYSSTPTLDARGREFAFTFTPTVTQDVVFTSTGASATPLLAVLRDDGAGCGAEAAVAGNYYSAKFHAEAGATYCLVLDGTTNTSLTAEVSLTCPASPQEARCDDQVDDDGDYLLDCADPDCFADPACGSGVCAPVATVDCGTRLVPGSTAEAGGSSVLAEYSCTGLDLGGREVVYEFKNGNRRQTILATLSNFSDYGAVAVIPAPTSPSSACLTRQCLAGDFYGARFTAEANQTYYVVVESTSTAALEYDLSILCSSRGDLGTRETSLAGGCTNGWDDDGDTRIDCDDPDCERSCSPGNVCSADTALTCGSRVIGSTADGASSDAVDSYRCAPGLEARGRERGFTFRPEASGTVAFALSAFSDYASVHVLEDTGRCDPYDCIAGQYYSAVAEVEAGRRYFVLVDGMKDDVPSVDFQLDVLCDPPATEEVCNNGVDDDGDTRIDCVDTDCAC